MWLTPSLLNDEALVERRIIFLVFSTRDFAPDTLYSDRIVLTHTHTTPHHTTPHTLILAAPQNKPSITNNPMQSVASLFSPYKHEAKPHNSTPQSWQSTHRVVRRWLATFRKHVLLHPQDKLSPEYGDSMVTRYRLDGSGSEPRFGNRHSRLHIRPDRPRGPPAFCNK